MIDAKRYKGRIRVERRGGLFTSEIVRLRNAGLISIEIMHRVGRELDLEDERLEI